MCQPLQNQNSKRHCSPQLLSLGNTGANGITVENPPKIMKKKQDLKVSSTIGCIDMGLLFFIQYHLKPVDKAIIFCCCQSKPRTQANSPAFTHLLYFIITRVSFKTHEHNHDVQSITNPPPSSLWLACQEKHQ